MPTTLCVRPPLDNRTHPSFHCLHHRDSGLRTENYTLLSVRYKRSRPDVRCFRDLLMAGYFFGMRREFKYPITHVRESRKVRSSNQIQLKNHLSFAMRLARRLALPMMCRGHVIGRASHDSFSAESNQVDPQKPFSIISRQILRRSQI